MARYLRTLFLVFLIAVTASWIYAETPKFAISADLGPTLQTLINTGGFGMGVSFEFAILDRFSLVPQFSYSTYGSTDIVTQITPGGQLRIYPISDAITGFWFSAGYNYAMITRTAAGTTASATVSAIIIDAGYKWVLGGEKGLFLEPYAGYGLIFTEAKTVGAWDYGFSFGFCF